MVKKATSGKDANNKAVDRGNKRLRSSNSSHNLNESLFLLSVLAVGMAVGAGMFRASVKAPHTLLPESGVVSTPVTPPTPVAVGRPAKHKQPSTLKPPCEGYRAAIPHEHNPIVEDFTPVTHIPVSVFTRPECDMIVREAMKGKLVEALVQLEGEDHKVHQFLDDSRRTKATGVDKFHPTIRFVYQRVIDTVYSANLQFWRYNLTRNPHSNLIEHIQFQIYNASNLGHYTWHQDQSIRGELATRRVSVTIQLSDPDTYEGGNLQIKSGKDEVNMSRNMGDAVIFPSYSLHRVTPVTKGIRASMAIWFHEPHPQASDIVELPKSWNQQNVDPIERHHFELRAAGAPPN